MNEKSQEDFSVCSYSYMQQINLFWLHCIKSADNTCELVKSFWERLQQLSADFMVRQDRDLVSDSQNQKHMVVTCFFVKVKDIRG